MSIYVVSEQMGLDGYWITDILKGIKSEADKKNLRVEDFHFPTDGEGRLVLAVGYTKGWLQEAADKIKRIGAKSIIVNASPDSGIENAGAFVGFDYVSAMSRLAEYLKYCGKSRIAFVGCGGRLSYDIKNRAFQAAAAKTGIYCRSYRFASIAELTASVVRDFRAFDAVVCSRDVEACHVINAFGKRRVEIPESIYVVGIGGNKVSGLSSPDCTTVETDFEKLGVAAVKLHRFLSQNPDVGGISITVDCPIIVRKSTDGKNMPAAVPQNPTRLSNYRVDADYLSYLRAEALARGCDKTDRNILSLLSKGKSMAEIAEELFISQSSVKYRVKKMLQISDIPDRRELIKIAQIFGLL